MFRFLKTLSYLATSLDTPEWKGARGERRVAKSIARHFDGSEYTVVTDVTLPTERGTTQIDHIVLCRYGVFVIETKNMSGWIFGDEKRKYWTQTHYKRKTRIRNPIHQNFGHIKAAQELLGVKDHSIHGIVAFVGDAEPKTDLPNMVVWDVQSLVQKIRTYSVPVFTQKQLEKMMLVLSDPTIATTGAKRKEHIANVQRISDGLADPIVPPCPRCGAKMILRINKKTNEKFYGCSNFPRCRGSRHT